MPRQARAVYPGVPHHVTHRANGDGELFLEAADYASYLHLFQKKPAGLRILAWCLMPNHVHWVVVPRAAADLASTFRRAHGLYAQGFNGRHRRSGHLWQGRFFSAPLSSGHLRNALRYVERNPVRANLASHPESWPWYSAPAHLSGDDATGLLDMTFWKNLGGLDHWRQLLAMDEGERFRAALRWSTRHNTLLD